MHGHIPGRKGRVGRLAEQADEVVGGSFLLEVVYVSRMLLYTPDFVFAYSSARSVCCVLWDASVAVVVVRAGLAKRRTQRWTQNAPRIFYELGSESFDTT